MRTFEKKKNKIKNISRVSSNSASKKNKVCLILVPRVSERLKVEGGAHRDGRYVFLIDFLHNS